MINVGEYIRTKAGQIGKVIEIKKRKELADQIYLDIRCNDEFYNVFVYDFDIKSHSKNIIDLIEVGDIVNGMRVIATENRGRYNEEKQKDEKVILAENYDEWTENGVISNEDIKTILTHEMYEQNCYKVGED